MSLSALSIAREIFPDRDDQALEDIIWNRTGWPVFWPARFRSVESALRAQLKAFRRAVAGLREGERLCTFCNRKARINDLCRRCAFILDRDEL